MRHPTQNTSDTTAHWPRARAEDYPVTSGAACRVCGLEIRATAQGVLRHSRKAGQ